ncbi:MAG: hypothetical protein ABIE47_15520, partial [Pseudomonadota bacterium]
ADEDRHMHCLQRMGRDTTKGDRITYRQRGRKEMTMPEKWAVAYEYDLDNGLCFLAKKDADQRQLEFPPDDN